jgi:hypothetical protein
MSEKIWVMTSYKYPPTAVGGIFAGIVRLIFQRPIRLCQQVAIFPRGFTLGFTPGCYIAPVGVEEPITKRICQRTFVYLLIKITLAFAFFLVNELAGKSFPIMKSQKTFYNVSLIVVRSQ